MSMSVDTPNASGSASPDDTTPDTLTLKVDTSGQVTVVEPFSRNMQNVPGASESQTLTALIDKRILCPPVIVRCI
jgi:hypothetical protein